MGFAFTELLGFKLLPRLKNIGAIQLYAPGANQAAWARLETANISCMLAK